MSDRNLRIRVLLEGADRLTRPMRDAAAGSTRLAQTIRVTRDQLKGLERTQSDLGQLRQLKAGLRDTEKRMAEAQARTTQLGRALAQTEDPTKKMRAEFDRARRESERLGNEHRQETARLQELRSRLTAAGVSTRDLAGNERRLRTEVERTTAELRDQERRLQEVTDRSRRCADARARFSSVQGAATGLAAGGAAAIGTGMVMARPLEGAVEDSMQFESVMTDINQKVNQSRKAGRLMGLELRKAALAVNQMPEDLQHGVDTLTGFGLEAGRAVDMMAPIGRAATAYKADIDDLGRASFAAYDNLKVPIAQAGKALDIMAQAGKSGAFEVKDMAQYFPELTASMQSLGATGVPAVADLAAALQITRKGAGDSAGAANNLQNLLSKINARDTIKNFAKFGIDIPAAMKKAAKDGRSPIEEIVRLTQMATGGDQAKLSSLFGDMQVQQALRPLMSAFQEYRSIRADALAAEGTVNTDFADRMNDTAEKVKRLKIQSKELSTTLGDQLAPMAGSASERLSVWGDKVSKLAERHPNLVRGLAVAAAVFAALFLVLGGGAIVMAGLVAPFAVLSATATALGIGLLPLIGIVAGVVAGVVLLAGAAYLIYAKWDGIAAWFGDRWTEIKGYFTGGISGLTAMLVNFSPIGLLYRGIASMLDWLGMSLPSRLSEIGGHIIQGLINGIASMYGALKSRIVETASWVAKWFKETLGIHSPSRVFARLGGFVMAGLDQGLADNTAAPLQRISTLSEAMTRSFNADGRGMLGRFNDASGKVASALAAGAAAVPAMALASPTAIKPEAHAFAGTAPSSATYNITINAGTAPARDIAEEVRNAIEQIERERRGRGFGDE
ncbi:phage tail tape measure protein [Novosphingobium mathurense]|uniref:Phage tail tape measure protein, TP901 family, core region n=1 Tax=Novosphingobium mathurense TaxID=428990 RepID=A0A1U6IN61_9SPHN|nr:phage tail tape measure protein [Novosphingobium mathurense]SLK09481.1 phage tail tape measure protein, TP901 family, core region [Novosphingobium mathurense]